MKKLFVIFFTSFALIQAGNAGIGFGAVPGSLTFNSLLSVKKHPMSPTKNLATYPTKKLAQRHVTRPHEMLRLSSR